MAPQANSIRKTEISALVQLEYVVLFLLRITTRNTIFICPLLLEELPESIFVGTDRRIGSFDICRPFATHVGLGPWLSLHFMKTVYFFGIYVTLSLHFMFDKTIWFELYVDKGVSLGIAHLALHQDILHQGW